MNSVLYDPSHALVPTGGGQRRTLQVAHLIAQAGFGLNQVDRAAPFPLIQRVLTGLRIYFRSAFPLVRVLRLLRAVGLEYLRYQAAIRSHTGGRVLVWERTRGAGVVAPYAAIDSGWPIVAVPHNLESLVAGQSDPFARSGTPAARLRDEVNHLRRSTAVFCISHEERWLLANLGVAADTLPYFPIPSIEAELLGIRACRNPSSPGRFLIFGTAGNPPVRAGMIELLRFAQPVARRVGVELHVAGNDTETLANEVSDGTRLHGTVSAERLAELMATARGVVIWQRNGSGALTRIPECLLAGLPVLANGVAARSHYHTPGVYLFESADELADLISGELPTPAPPARPCREEARFVNCLRSLARGEFSGGTVSGPCGAISG